MLEFNSTRIFLLGLQMDLRNGQSKTRQLRKENIQFHVSYYFFSWQKLEENYYIKKKIEEKRMWSEMEIQQHKDKSDHQVKLPRTLKLWCSCNQ